MLKKQRVKELTQSQKGAMERFIIKEPQVFFSHNAKIFDQDTAEDTENPNHINDSETETPQILLAKLLIVLMMLALMITWVVLLQILMMHLFMLIYLI